MVLAMQDGMSDGGFGWLMVEERTCRLRLRLRLVSAGCL